ncbi:MAG: ATP-binding protein, partial [Tissierellia bacterium]|nr:ATP-binding protein [Tissierellia bacterium]
YGIHGVLGIIDDLSKEEIKDYLLEMRDTSNIAMKELRKSIYKLSSRKKGKKYLQESIQNFLDSITKLHDVSINFSVEGDENLIILELKKGLTRIIREACGNAIRHGKCRNISIELCISPNDINLLIKDDGDGFELSSVGKKDGLGLSNMKALVNSYNGSIEIKSKINQGTNINILLPHHVYNKESIAI